MYWLPLICCVVALRPTLAGQSAESLISTTADQHAGFDTSRTELFYATLLSPRAAELGQAGSLPEKTRLSFLAHGRVYNLTLRRAPAFLDPDFLVLHRYDNFTSIAQAGGSGAGSCFYWGEVTRTGLRRPGWVAVNLCDSMVGIMQVGDENFVIEPRRGRRHVRSSDRSRPGVVGPQTIHRVGRALRMECDKPTPPRSAGTAAASRRRRDTRRHALTVELAVFVDLPLQKQMKDLYGEHTDAEITRFVMAMVNAMELLYDGSTLRRKIRFILKRLELLETAPEELERQRDINAFLTNFCNWQQRHNPPRDEDPLHWDHAVLLTGVDLYTSVESREVNRQVVGFAPVGGMCTSSSSCTVNEGKDFESVYIVAHEIGHSLGMHHDGQGNSCNKENHIMSPTLGTGKNTWSACSREYLDRFAETRQAECLKDSSLGEDVLSRRQDTLPGERIGADEQCRLKYGPSSERAREQPLADVCVNLHCKYDRHRWTSHPALEGTACGYDNWCRRGKCVPRDYTSDPRTKLDVPGGWSQWSAFAPCASSCLYGADRTLASGSTGVRQRFRRCNSPYPQNGGAECKGGARQYETCKADELCRRTGRTIIDYADEICKKAARLDIKLSGRGISRVTSNAFDACNIWCERRDGGYQRHRQSFPDGARCATREAFHRQPQYCVDGRCEAFLCDSADSLFSAGAEECGRLPVRDVDNDLRLMAEADSWSDWRSYSRCRFSCTAPAKGLELVQRDCRRPPCRGLEKSVRHCTPRMVGTDCVTLRTPFEHASDICRQYRDKLGLSQLSGIGMQLSATAEDPDRPCTVTCQDRDASLRFYRVKEREGWFPTGMDCSRGEEGRTAFCLSGKCVDFGPDGTPLHDSKYDYAYLFEASFRFHRVLRDLSLANLTRISSGRIRDGVDREFIQGVITDLRLEDNSTSVRTDDDTPSRDISADDIDLNNPLIVAELPPDFPDPVQYVKHHTTFGAADFDNSLGHAFAMGEEEHQVILEDEASLTTRPTLKTVTGTASTLLTAELNVMLVLVFSYWTIHKAIF